MTDQRWIHRLPGLIGMVFMALALAAAMLTWAQAQSSVLISKSANPSTLLEPGGSVTFSVRITNSSTVDTIYLTGLTDSVHGNLDRQGTCRARRTILPRQTYACQFGATVNGNAGYVETDTVTASGSDDDGDPFSVSADATVTIADVASSIGVTKTASPGSLVEPGGQVTFTVRVQNQSAIDSVTVYTLTDSVYGDLSGQGTCALPRTLSPLDAYSCSFQATVSGNAGDSETDTVTAEGIDDDSMPVRAQASATVAITDASPVISVTKRADPAVARAGDRVSFAIEVTNQSNEPVTLTRLNDTVLGDLRVTCGLPALIPAAALFECETSLVVTGDHTNTVTATARDDEGNRVTRSDTASVDVIDPAIQVTKEADKAYARAGETITYSYLVQNVGDVLLTGISATDDLIGTIALSSASLDPGQIATGTAAYRARFADLPGPISNIAIVTGIPPVGDVVTDSDVAEVPLTDVQFCQPSTTAYWQLDEANGTIYYDSFWRHDGQCVGNCPTSRTGRVNGGQEFGLDTGIDVPSHTAFDWTAADSFSIEFWARTEADSTCAGNQVIVGRDDSSLPLHWWAGCQQGGQAAFYLRDNAGNLAGVVGTTDLTDGAWHHIAAVRDASANQILIYVDGSEEGVAQAGYTGSFASPNAAVNIGWLNASQPYHYVGLVDELALYSSALPPATVYDHFGLGWMGLGYCQAVAFPPTIVSAPVNHGVVGQLYRYDVDAIGNPAPTYALLSSPSGMAIDPDTGLITWTPSSEQQGTHNVQVRAGNSEGTDIQDYTIVVPRDMIAYWKLDETTAPPYADYYDGHDGWCGQACPTPSSGYILGAQAFNGIDAEVSVPAHIAFDWNQSDTFSIEFWLKTNPDSNCTGGQVVIGRNDSTTQLHWWVGCKEGGQAVFYLRSRSGTLAGVVGTSDLTDGDWHHVVAMRDGEAHEIRLYVDGTEEGSVAASYVDGFDSGTAELNVGWLDLSHGYHLAGTIDEIVIYRPSRWRQSYLPILLIR